MPAKAPVVPAGAPVVPAGASVVPAGAPVVPAKAPVVPAGASVVPAGASIVPAVKKLAVLLLVALVATALYRRWFASPPDRRQHQHGTPDHWPPVVHKPVPDAAPAT
ncbi:MAG: hypothetical protein M0Z46_06910 [Actinomycetota bacterium]|nr:hypothetical protein [Actinomycetota bacterium]MDA8358939.1 hypothetical protein [Actinomycetota bacterium]